MLSITPMQDVTQFTNLGSVPIRPVHLDRSILDEIPSTIVFVWQRMQGLERIGVGPFHVCAG